MRIDQAIFTSANDRTRQGYQLVARSEGIDSAVADQLAHWLPSHAAIAHPDAHASSINFFPLGDDQYVISRTAYGGAEYSSRGGAQILTRAIVASITLLENYDNNALVLVRTTAALGLLRVPLDPPRKLHQVDVPDWPLPRSTRRRAQAPLDQPCEQALAHLRDRLDEIGDGARVCVVGDCDPLVTCEQLFLAAPDALRARLSVATGIWPSVSRPYQIHFLPRITALRKSRLKAQGVDHVIEI